MNNGLFGNRPPGGARLVVLTGSDFFNPADYMARGFTRARVTAVGPGGGSGGTAATAAGQSASSGGGGGGGEAIKDVALIDLAPREPYFVASAGGTAGTSGANNGSAGSATTFGSGANLLTANSGAGGTGSISMVSGSVSGGNGGSATGGDLNIAGGDAGSSAVRGGLISAYSFGGSNRWGHGATSNGAAVAGLPYGGGASGAVAGASSGAQAGAAGAVGMILVELYWD